MMEKYKCNAFSTACVELCRSRIPQNRKFVPCMRKLSAVMGFTLVEG
jgi:hypothetical protein